MRSKSSGRRKEEAVVETLKQKFSNVVEIAFLVLTCAALSQV